MTTITYCTNDETILQSITVGEIQADGDTLEADRENIATTWCDAVYLHLVTSDVEDELDIRQASNFARWHGGYYDQMGYRIGCIHCDEKDPPEEIINLMQAALDAGQKAVNELMGVTE